MGRKHLVKLSDGEYEALLKAKKLVKQFGVSTFSKEAQETVKNSALGDYIHLGSQLIIEHIAKHFNAGDIL